MQRTVPVVVNLMGPIEETLIEALFPALFWGGEIDAEFWKILGYIVKPVVLGIPDPQSSTESVYSTSEADSR